MKVNSARINSLEKVAIGPNTVTIMKENSLKVSSTAMGFSWRDMVLSTMVNSITMWSMVGVLRFGQMGPTTWVSLMRAGSRGSASMCGTVTSHTQGSGRTT